MHCTIGAALSSNETVSQSGRKTQQNANLKDTFI